MSYNWTPFRGPIILAGENADSGAPLTLVISGYTADNPTVFFRINYVDPHCEQDVSLSIAVPADKARGAAGEILDWTAAAV